MAQSATDSPPVLPGLAEAWTTGIFRDFLDNCADILELRSWRKVDPIAYFLLAAFTAVIAQPIVYGPLGLSIVTFVTPAR